MSVQRAEHVLADREKVKMGKPLKFECFLSHLQMSMDDGNVVVGMPAALVSFPKPSLSRQYY